MVFGTHRSQRDRFVSVDTHPLCITCRKAIIDLDIAAYSPSELLQPLLQGDSTSLRFSIIRNSHQHDNSAHTDILGPRGERPRCRCTA